MISAREYQHQFWYSLVDINIISNTSIVNNCLIIYNLSFLLVIQHQASLIQSVHVDVSVTTGDITKSWYWLDCMRLMSLFLCRPVNITKYRLGWKELWANEKPFPNHMINICYKLTLPIRYLLYGKQGFQFGGVEVWTRYSVCSQDM